MPCPECQTPIIIVDDNTTGEPTVELYSADQWIDDETGTSALANKGLATVSTLSRRTVQRRETTGQKNSQTRTPQPGQTNGRRQKSESAKTAIDSNLAKSSTTQSESAAPTSNRFLNSATIAWIVAGILAISLVIFAWPDSSEFGSTGNQQDSTDTNPVDSGNGEQTQNSPQVDQPLPTVPNDLDGRLRMLGHELNRYHLKQGHYPTGRQIDQRPGKEGYSWMAELVAASDDSVAADWNASWNNPSQTEFVRRKMPLFLNPNFNRLTGNDGYPASHFAGISGVGIDAASLPKDHSRAGIFGYQRRTTRDDIKDGLANTMMVAGVSDGFRAWAAGDGHSIRALTNPPYINGNDGFGTGETGGMSVLLADGSVQFISEKTDPRLVRRMAAMADGLPLDENVPGEPGEVIDFNPPEDNAEELTPKSEDPESNNPEPMTPDDPSDNTSEPKVTLEPGETDEPATPIVEGKTIEQIESALTQPINAFVLPAAVSCADLLDEVAEMSGVAIVVDDRDSPDMKSRLSSHMRLNLQATTVRKILDRATADAGLVYEIETNRIRVFAAETNEADSQP